MLDLTILQIGEYFHDAWLEDSPSLEVNEDDGRISVVLLGESRERRVSRRFRLRLEGRIKSSRLSRYGIGGMNIQDVIVRATEIGFVSAQSGEEDLTIEFTSPEVEVEWLS